MQLHLNDLSTRPGQLNWTRIFIEFLSDGNSAETISAMCKHVCKTISHSSQLVEMKPSEESASLAQESHTYTANAADGSFCGVTQLSKVME